MKNRRISGTSLGGGTLWGLLSMMTNAKNYDEMLELSKKGDNKNIDMLVSAIHNNASFFIKNLLSRWVIYMEGIIRKLD